MSLPRVTLRRASRPVPLCTTCQRSILFSFINSLTSPRCIASPADRRRLPSTFRPFSQYHTIRSDQKSASSDAISTQDDLDFALPPPIELNDSKPWYLQLEQEEIAPRSTPKNQIIPEIPQNAPSILEPLLKYISIDVGLDYLSLFDLRALDPPPALGANLIMILGTARSEKHLHVSADRLCRWLRKEHRLSPNADGLLGRNEVKLRLKRKAKRQKIMGLAGGSMRRDYDDGLSSSWICVNLGAVGDNTSESSVHSTSQEGFVGFGSQGGSTKIVVQMMTNDKRGDLDLESLWQDVLNRAERKKKWRLPAGSQDTSETAMTELIDRASVSQPHVPLRSAIGTGSIFEQQRRSFHSTSKYRNTSQNGDVRTPSEAARITEVQDHNLQREESNTRHLSGDNLRSPIQHVFSRMRGSMNDLIEQAPALKRLLDELRDMSRSDALLALGEGANDKDSTAWLRSLYASLPSFKATAHYACLLDYFTFALDIEHRGYTQEDVNKAFRDMAASGVFIPRDVGLYVFHKVLTTAQVPASRAHSSNSQKTALSDPAWAGHVSFRFSLMIGFEVLETLEGYGHSISDSDIFVILHTAINGIRFRVAASPIELNRMPKERILQANYNLRKAIDLLFPQPHPDSFTVMLLHTYAQQRDWRAFWTVWERVAIAMRPRSADMYTALFKGVAASGDDEHGRKVLRRWFPEMAREQPPVSVTSSMATAIMDCMHLAGIDQGSVFNQSQEPA